MNRLIENGTVAGACASFRPEIIQKIQKAFVVKNKKLVYFVNEESVNKVRNTDASLNIITFNLNIYRFANSLIIMLVYTLILLQWVA